MAFSKEELLKEIDYNLQHCFCSERTKRIMEIARETLVEEPVAYVTVQGGCRAPDDCEFFFELSEKDDISCNGEPAFPIYEKRYLK